jgi:NADH-quinone oxidoreductase subunit E
VTAETFAFTAENADEADRIIAKYPQGRQASAVIPLLHLAQVQHGGWLPGAAVEMVAEKLGMASIRVWEVATFYTMFNHKPVGKYRVQVCTTTPCWLRGSDDITKACRDELGINFGEVTADGRFSLHEIECAGACVNAPVVQLNDDYYEDLEPARMKAIIASLRHDEVLPPGSQTGRDNSAPAGAKLTLVDVDENGKAIG